MFIIGHRGARAVEPENTLRAIRAGMRCARYVEVDVRLTRDRVPVILHDAGLERTTEGRGPVGDLGFTDVRRLDAGKGEKIPTLEEVCREVRDRCGLFLELKEPGSEQEVSIVLRDSGPRDLWIVSFHPECIRAMKALCPKVRTGYIFSRMTPDPVSIAVDLGCQAILPKYALITTDLVRTSHASGRKVIPWTLNSAVDILKARDLGVDGFATDDPCRARDYLRENPR
ncbi:MAG: glycerophosphodiester phosphodiesterase [Methanoregulaceae archaeon]|nr:glycerophosphodiester phosphodiesterase [Methanoregulaceae archaeon]